MILPKSDPYEDRIGVVSKLTNQQVQRAGEYLVAAELHRRGAYAVTFSGNMPDIDILASDAGQTKTIGIQVKTKRSGTWHTTTTRGEARSVPAGVERYWILVDIGRDTKVQPLYFVVPDGWITDHIHDEFEAFLKRSGGERPRNPESKHFALRPRDMARWEGRWDVLGILGAA